MGGGGDRARHGLYRTATGPKVAAGSQRDLWQGRWGGRGLCFKMHGSLFNFSVVARTKDQEATAIEKTVCPAHECERRRLAWPPEPPGEAAGLVRRHRE